MSPAVGYGRYGAKFRGYYVPNYSSFLIMLKVVVYRGGLR
jgi:hypothetical protein